MTAAMREVLSFEEMAELAFTWPEDRRLTVSMLGELQMTLVAGTSGELSNAGGIRVFRGLPAPQYAGPSPENAAAGGISS